MQPRKADYRALALLAVFIAGVLVAGALLAPPLFFAAQSCIKSHPGTSVSAVLAKSEFPGYFNRAAMFAAFVGLAPLLRSLRLSWPEVTGTLGARRGVKDLAAGFIIALLWMLAMGAVCFLVGAAKLKSSPNWTGVFMPLVSGFAVATLEEMLFRGAVLGILSHSLGAVRGLWWTSGLFAILHFLKPPLDGTFAPEQVTWTSGFAVIPHLFRGFGQLNNFVGEFLLLLAVGLVLAAARKRSGGLWLGIGLHAGWVAGMKYFGQIVSVTKLVNEGALAPWMIRNTCKSIVSPIVGIVPVLAVVLTGATILLVLLRSRTSKAESRCQ